MGALPRGFAQGARCSETPAGRREEPVSGPRASKALPLAQKSQREDLAHRGIQGIRVRGTARVKLA